MKKIIALALFAIIILPGCIRQKTEQTRPIISIPIAKEPIQPEKNQPQEIVQPSVASSSNSISPETYTNKDYGFKFQYSNNYKIIRVEERKGFEEWAITKEINNPQEIIMSFDLTDWKKYIIDENSAGTQYQKIAYDDWKYFVDNFNNIKSGNCDEKIIEHIPDSIHLGYRPPKLCIVYKTNNYIKIETEYLVNYYFKNLEISFNFNNNSEPVKQIVSTIKFIN
jgi:hypothetical protein